MFALAFIIGIYSYLIFFLGIVGHLNKISVILLTAIYLFIIFILFLKLKVRFRFKLSRIDSFSLLLLVIVFTQALVNFIGVLGPEISFDALWYHLTLPKIFLISQKITHIPGNLFY